MKKTILPSSFEGAKFPNQRVTYSNSKDGDSTGNIFPNHHLVKNWCFPYSYISSNKFIEGLPIYEQVEQKDIYKRSEIEATLEANLADAMARVAEIYGTSTNELQHIFPSVLRMLRSDSVWSK